MPLYGKFELLSRLARGGMAEVFLARQRSEGRFERLVVIKRILPWLADDNRFVELFLEEARIAALLDHPNIVPIYDLGRVDHTFFIAMPYVQGLSLLALTKDARARELSVGPAVASEIVRQALMGLEYAHDKAALDGQPLNLVHRDVSPGNMMVNEQGRVMLLDFGIAVASDSASVDTGSLRGKLTYMSPEQLRVEELDRRSDIFSLGIVFHELLTGQRLFKRKDDLSVIRAVAEDSIPRPSDLCPNLPPPLERVVMRALERDRQRRFSAAKQMRFELESAVTEAGLPGGRAVVRQCLERDFHEALDQAARKAQRARDAEPPALPAVPSPPDLYGGGDESDTAAEVPERKRQRAPRARQRTRPLFRVLVGVLLLTVPVALGVLFFTTVMRPARPEGPPLRVAFTPYLPDEVLRREWRPVLDYLEQQTGRPVMMSTELSYDHTVDKLVNGHVDIADLSAYPYLLALKRDPDIRPLATATNDNSSSYESYLVVRRQDEANQLVDLKGRRVCYVDPTSTSGFFLPRVLLRKAGHDPEAFFGSHQFSGNHFRALRDLLASRCDMAAVTSGAFLSAQQEGIDVANVRVLSVSPPVPHGVFCASSRMSEEEAAGLAQVLLQLNMEQLVGARQLSKVLPLTGFEPVDTQAFEDLAKELDSLP